MRQTTADKIYRRAKAIQAGIHFPKPNLPTNKKADAILERHIKQAERIAKRFKI